MADGGRCGEEVSCGRTVERRNLIVIPAEAGIQATRVRNAQDAWAPASAGETDNSHRLSRFIPDTTGPPLG